MKKTVVALLTIAMVIVFAGCGGIKKEQPVSPSLGSSETDFVQSYVSNGKEKNVSITDFMNLMMCDKGKWDCPVQNADYGLEFSLKDGRYLLNMSKINSDTATAEHLLVEIAGVSFNEEHKTYCVSLLEYDQPIEYKELHVDASAIGKGVIHTENIYCNFRSDEYVFIADSGDFIHGKVTASGNQTITPNVETESEIVGVESRTWMLKDENLMDEYKPLISLDSAGYFSFKENLYSGMGHMYGTYLESEKTIECYVYSIDFSGYAGEDTYYIVFEKTSPTTLTLRTNICYSMSGAVFELQ